MRKKREEEDHVNHERWLLTYADLITLLMIFFIVLYTLSKVDADKFRAVADSLNNAIGGGTPAKADMAQNSGPSVIPLEKGLATAKSNAEKAATNGKSDAEKGEAEAKSLQAIKQEIDNFVAGNGLEARVETSIEERGLVVSIRDTLLFNSGSAQISSDALQILGQLGSIFSGLTNYLRVEGHTDNVPIHTSQFPSNWELSAARALNVVNVLISRNVPSDKLSATGYGEYRPVLPNTSSANMEKNRRVDLVIMRGAYDITEPNTQQPSQ